MCLNLQFYAGDQVLVHVQIGKVHLLIKMQKSTKVMAGTGKPFLLTFLPMEVGCCPGCYCYFNTLYICIIMGGGMPLTLSYLYLAGDTDFN